MARRGRIKRVADGQEILDYVTWCSSYFCKLKGLMFRRALKPGEGLLMVEARASRANTSIHMLFVAFSIATIWMNDDFVVVDKVLAKPWRLAYVPKKAARYTLETVPDLLEVLQIGDRLSFEP